MKKKCLIVLNHQPSKEMVEELGANGFVVEELPNNLKELWGNIPATTSLELVRVHINPIMHYIIDNKFDRVVIAGEPTAIYDILSTIEFVYDADFPKKCYVPVSERVSIDEPQPDGSVKKISKFIYSGLRPYYVSS
jgi:hypothetical protein